MPIKGQSSAIGLAIALSACGGGTEVSADAGVDLNAAAHPKPKIDRPSKPVPPPNTTDAEELQMFARVFGYVRYFSASDAAARVDWDAFAVWGAGEIVKVDTRDGLRERLNTIFAPMAPGLQVLARGESPQRPALPADRAGLEVVTWQHRGFGDSLPPNGHASKRTARATVIPGKDGVDKTITEDLFERFAEPDDLISRPISVGLVAHFPIALLSREGKMLSPAKGPLPDLSGVPDDATDLAVRRAAVIVAWNALQHFSPNLDRIRWAKALPTALTNAAAMPGGAGLQETLGRMLANTQDGNAAVTVDSAPEAVRFPVRLERVADKIVVTWAPKGSTLQRGDVVVSIDGEPVDDKVAAARWRVAGTPWYVENTVLGQGWIAVGAVGTTVAVTVQRTSTAAAATEHALSVALGTPPPRNEFEHPPIEAYPDGTMVVDLGAATWQAIEPRIAEIANAPGVVFDLRLDANDNREILAHLLDAPENANWMLMPTITLPDLDRVLWERESWDIQPATPRIKGNAVFIAGPGTTSAAESVLQYVTTHRMGEIVGSKTPGRGGNRASFRAPGGANVSFTSTRITTHDGHTPHFGVGTSPTRETKRTRDGIAAARDELRERALAVARGG